MTTTSSSSSSATSLPSVVQERQRRAKLRRNMFYLALLVVGLVAPFVAYPVFFDEDSLFCAVCLRFQSAVGLCWAALVWPCGLLGDRWLCDGLSTGQLSRPHARTGYSRRHGDGDAAGGRCLACSPFVVRASTLPW